MEFLARADSGPAAGSISVLPGIARRLVPGLLVLEPEPQDLGNANALHLAMAGWRGTTLCSLNAPIMAASPAPSDQAQPAQACSDQPQH
jgi:hypothetical protein